MVSFQEWVDSEGGQRKCAKRHGFPPASLGAWYRLERYPKPSSQARIQTCSKHSVDMADLLKRFVAANNNPLPKIAARRLKGSYLVSNLQRLKRVLAELGIPESRANLHGERITARWSTTNVSVSEVRQAVELLAMRNADYGDIQLIHKTIGEARSAALGRLGK